MNFDNLCNKYLRDHIFTEAPAAPVEEPDIEEPDIEEPIEKPSAPPERRTAPQRPPNWDPLSPHKDPNVKPGPMARKALSTDTRAFLASRRKGNK